MWDTYVPDSIFSTNLTEPPLLTTTTTTTTTTTRTTRDNGKFDETIPKVHKNKIPTIILGSMIGIFCCGLLIAVSIKTYLEILSCHKKIKQKKSEKILKKHGYKFSVRKRATIRSSRQNEFSTGVWSTTHSALGNFSIRNTDRMTTFLPNPNVATKKENESLLNVLTLRKNNSPKLTPLRRAPPPPLSTNPNILTVQAEVHEREESNNYDFTTYNKTFPVLKPKSLLVKNYHTTAPLPLVDYSFSDESTCYETPPSSFPPSLPEKDYPPENTPTYTSVAHHIYEELP